MVERDSVHRSHVRGLTPDVADCGTGGDELARTRCAGSLVVPRSRRVADSPWNSLEVVKVVIAVLTPLLILGLGFVVNRASRRVEEAQWGNQKVIEERLQVYREMAPLLNQLYCFFLVRGDFRTTEPPEVIGLKRDLDKKFHMNRFLFSDGFARLYGELMELCFETFVGFGVGARLRVDPAYQRREMGADLWRDEWDDRFSPPEERTHRDKIAEAYEAFMACFASELGVGPKPS